jgi:branched-chain amino acid transport system permease protein
MLQGLLTIAVLTSVYAILASGVVVLYRGSRVLNLAHGEISVLLGYAFASIGLGLTGSIFGGVIVAAVLCVVLGIAVFYALMRHLVGQPFYVTVLATIGIAILAKAAILLFWGGRATNIQLGLSYPIYRFEGGGWLSMLDAMTVVSAVIFFVLLNFFLTRTRLGIQFRAVAENPLLASQRGTNVNKVLITAWIVALIAASLAGILYGSRSVLSLQTVIIGIGGLTAALVGGLDSLRGSIAGALFVAVAEYATIRWIDPVLSEAIPFILLLAVMTWRPWGIFGTPEDIQRV